MGNSTYERTGKLQRKIDVYLRAAGGGAIYLSSTNWHATCREAVASVRAARGERDAPGKVFARFADKRSKGARSWATSTVVLAKTEG